MPGSEGLLLKRSTSSYRKQIISVLQYGKVLNFYESTTLIKYLLRWIRIRKCTRNNWDIIYILQKSLYSTKNYIIRDLFLRRILTDQLFPDTGIRTIPELAMAGFFASSSQTWLPPQSTYFVSKWQSDRVVLRFDSHRLVFYSTWAIGLEVRE